MPLPSYARVTNLRNQRSIIVRVNDRGPYHGGRIMDLSARAAEALDYKAIGTAKIKVEYVGRAALSGSDDRKLLATLRVDGQPAQLGDFAYSPTRLAEQRELPRAPPRRTATASARRCRTDRTPSAKRFRAPARSRESDAASRRAAAAAAARSRWPSRIRRSAARACRRIRRCRPSVRSISARFPAPTFRFPSPGADPPQVERPASAPVAYRLVSRGSRAKLKRHRGAAADNSGACRLDQRRGVRAFASLALSSPSDPRLAPGRRLAALGRARAEHHDHRAARRRHGCGHPDGAVREGRRRSGSAGLAGQADDRRTGVSRPEKRLDHARHAILHFGARLEDGQSGGSMFARVNTNIRVEDLLRGLIVQSGNDAAIALAEGLGGSEENFAAMMNVRAAELGMSKSHFTDSWGGANPAQVVSARDMAILAEHLIKTYPEYYHFFGEKEFTWSKIRQLNRNPILFLDVNGDGLKVGNEKDGDFNIVGSAVFSGQRLIVVIMGAKTAKDRAEEARRLFNWGFHGFDAQTIFDADETVGTAKVYGGVTTEVPLVSDAPVRVMISARLARKAERQNRLCRPADRAGRGRPDRGAAQDFAWRHACARHPAEDRRSRGAGASVAARQGRRGRTRAAAFPQGACDRDAFAGEEIRAQGAGPATPAP